MKKTLAVFLTVLMLLSLAPSVLAGSGIMNALFTDSGSTKADAQDYTFGRVPFDKTFNTLEDGVYIIATGNSTSSTVYAMGNEFNSYNTGIQPVQLTENGDDEEIVVSSEMRNVFWEIKNDNGSLSLKNAGNGQYLYINGTYETNSIAWKDSAQPWNVYSYGDSISIQPTIASGNSRALDRSLSSGNFVLNRGDSLESVIRFYQYEGDEVIVTPAPTPQPDIPTEGHKFVEYDMYDIIDYGNPIDDGVYVIAAEFENKTYAMVNRTIDGVAAGIKYMESAEIKLETEKDEDSNDVSYLMDPSNTMRWEIRNVAGGYTIRNAAESKYLSVQINEMGTLTVLRFDEKASTWTGEVFTDTVNGKVVDPFFLFLSGVMNPNQKNYHMFTFDTKNKQFYLTFVPQTGIKLYKLEGEEGVLPEETVTTAPATTAPLTETNTPTVPPQTEAPVLDGQFIEVPFGEEIDSGLYIIAYKRGENNYRVMTNELTGNVGYNSDYPDFGIVYWVGDALKQASMKTAQVDGENVAVNHNSSMWWNIEKKENTVDGSTYYTIQSHDDLKDEHIKGRYLATAFKKGMDMVENGHEGAMTYQEREYRWTIGEDKGVYTFVNDFYLHDSLGYFTSVGDFGMTIGSPDVQLALFKCNGDEPKVLPDVTGTDKFTAETLTTSVGLGTYLITIQDYEGYTRAMTATAAQGFTDGFASTVVNPQLTLEGKVIMDPDTALRWVIEPTGNNGELKIRNLSNNKYLSAGYTTVADDGTESVTIGLCFTDGKDQYAIWTVDKIRTTDLSYTFKCPAVEGRNAYICHEDGVFSLYTNQRNTFTLYKFEGTTETLPPASETPVVTDSPDVTGTPDVTGSPDVTNTPDVDVTGTPDLTTDPALDTYTVTFVDWDGKVLTEVEVTEGEAAEAPAEEPTRENWVFAGWDADFTEVTEDMTVKAVYYKLGDVNLNGEPDAGDGTLVLREVVGSSDAPLSELQLKVADVNGTGIIDAGDATMILRHAVGTETIDYGPDAPAEEPEDDKEGEGK